MPSRCAATAGRHEQLAADPVQPGKQLADARSATASASAVRLSAAPACPAAISAGTTAAAAGAVSTSDRRERSVPGSENQTATVAEQSQQPSAAAAAADVPAAGTRPGREQSPAAATAPPGVFGHVQLGVVDGGGRMGFR